jgi:hypothetical protein
MKIEVSTRVFDTRYQEFVNHTIQIPVSKHIALALCEEIRQNIKDSRVIGHSDGTNIISRYVHHHPMRDEERYKMRSSLIVIEDTGEEVGGFSNL